jgi:hypothetical protein
MTSADFVVGCVERMARRGGRWHGECSWVALHVLKPLSKSPAADSIGVWVSNRSRELVRVQTRQMAKMKKDR